MQIKKLSDNKIKIIINLSDLHKNKTNLHSFMSKPILSQSLFLHILNIIKENFEFTIDNYQMKVNILKIHNNYFVLTITKLSTLKKEVPYNIYKVYYFDIYDNFENFLKLLKNLKINLNEISSNISLCLYNNSFYLILEKANLNLFLLKKFELTITEFAINTSASLLLIRKITEEGSIIINNKNLLNYFNKLK